MKKKWTIGIAALCVVMLLTGMYAGAAGGSNDPLVTLSYLTKKFVPQVQSMVDKSAAETLDKAQSAVDDATEEWQSKLDKVTAGTGNSGTGGFQAVSMGSGKSASIKTGCAVVVRSGSLTCTAELIDLTSGSKLSSGKTLTANHLYLAVKNCTLKPKTTTKQIGTVTEALNIRSGAGTSYSRLGVLTKGTTVDILEKGTSWHKVSGSGLTGYVSAAYIKLGSTTTTSGSAKLMVSGSCTVK